MKQPQLEDMIIKETLKAVFNWIVLILFVLALCWIGYLLSANDSKARTIEWYEKEHIKDAEINSINLSNHEKDSITISQMPPVEYLDFLKRQGK
jgi:hypothetical protein